MSEPSNRDFSIADVSREIRDEIAEIARVNEFGGFPPPTELSRYSKRLLVRSVFSSVECLTFLLKRRALEHAEPFDLSVGEQLIAKEQSFELTESGRIRLRKAKIRTLSNVRFAFDLYAKAYKFDFRLNTDSKGWACLQRTLNVRDRLTHPKSLSDLTVLDQEYTDSFKAFIWFERQVMLLLDKTIKTLETELVLRRGPSALAALGSIEHLRPSSLEDDV